MDYKAEFIRIFSENVSRPGAQQLLDWLATTDFYTAPASTRFHGACECGLVMHSINVYNVLMSRFYTEEDNKESFTLVSLLHDLCKANYYKSGFRNVKNDATGQWEKVPSYSVQDAFPFGHGEKSVYLIERFIRLKPVEAIAIRWHMGGFDDAVRGGSYAISNAFDEYPLAVKLHLADLEATYLVEKGTAAEPCCLMNPKRPRALVKGHAAYLLPQNMKTILKAVLSSGFLRPISVPAAPAAFPWAQGPRCGFFPGRFQTAPPSGCS